MNVIQEATVRQLHLREGHTEIRVGREDYITHQALDYIREKGLTLVEIHPPAENSDIRPAAGHDGAPVDKPEHMTHLYGDTLVPKTHPRIVLRGRLDSLEADIIILQTQTAAAGDRALTEDLGQLLTLCRSILSCEVTNRALPPLTLLGLDGDALREQSHHPQAHFGVGHLLADFRQGAVSAALNRLRAQSREVELAAVAAFCQADGTALRGDLLQALNRLSSAFYILMLRREKGRA